MSNYEITVSIHAVINMMIAKEKKEKKERQIYVATLLLLAL